MDGRAKKIAADLSALARLVAFLTVVSSAFASSALAATAELARPTGKVVLTIRGHITNTNDGAAARFDMAMLESIGTTTVVTDTPWTDKAVRFDGVLIARLLEVVGARGDTVEAVAINDYKIEIPVADFTDHPVILAYRMDGKRMRVRDKGPLWVIYPWSDFPDLKSEKYYNRSIWQVTVMELK
jgi:hypothetical protein